MAFLDDNTQLQDFILTIQDKLSGLGKIWLYALIAAVVLSIPLHFIFDALFFKLVFNNYQGPVITYQQPDLQPLQVTETKIFQLSTNTFAGFVKIKNINLDWGVPAQNYQASFKTLGGTTITRVLGQTFILPASTKILIFSKFSSDTKPESIVFTLGVPQFVHKPDLPQINLEVSRINLQKDSSTFTVSGVLTNHSPFIISRIDLPIVLYDLNNQIVGVNFTNINDVTAAEGRSFQFLWPVGAVTTAVRAEINPEVDIFDRSILGLPSGKSPFDTLQNGNSNSWRP